MGKICSSEEGRFRRADGALGYLQYSFSPDYYEKSFMVQMGLRKQSPLLSVAVPTIQSPAATNYCETRKRPIQNEGSELRRKWLTEPIKGPEEVELFKSLSLIG